MRLGEDLGMRLGEDHISQFTHQNKQYVGIDVHVSEPVRIGLSQSTKEERSLVEVYRGLVENHL